MRRFFVADLTSLGDLRSVAEYEYAQLERLAGASDLIVHLATHLYRSPQEFETTLPRRPELDFRWRASAETAGIATQRYRGELASLALLASGLNRDADRLTLDAFQKHLLRELHGTAFEPAFGLSDAPQRPLVAVVPFRAPDDPEDQLAVALADRCFAAAYFRYLNLA
jgi:hypothetical protein